MSPHRTLSLPVLAVIGLLSLACGFLSTEEAPDPVPVPLPPPPSRPNAHCHHRTDIATFATEKENQNFIRLFQMHYHHFSLCALFYLIFLMLSN